MSAAIQNLFDQAARFPGLLASGVLSGKRHIATRCHDPEMEEAELDKVWKHLSEAIEVAQHHRMPLTQMRWIFERVLLYGAKRADGLQLGLLFARAAAPELNQESLDPLFEEFRNLPFA
jgi:hypothetical protein